MVFLNINLSFVCGHWVNLGELSKHEGHPRRPSLTVCIRVSPLGSLSSDSHTSECYSFCGEKSEGWLHVQVVAQILKHLSLVKFSDASVSETASFLFCSGPRGGP